MESTFWGYTIWYILLAATSAAAVAMLLRHARERRKTLAFWLAVLGFTYFLEVWVMLVLRAYIYHPMFVADEFFDAVLGNVFSQVSVSSSAVLICVLGLSNWWLGGFSIAYFLIDLWYSHLGAYQHFWYRSVYTLAGFFIYGLIVRHWYKKFFGGPPSKRLYVPTHFLSAWAVSGNVFGTFFRLIVLRVFQSGLYDDPSEDHTATGLIYSATMTVIMMALYKWRRPWRYRLPVFLLLLACQFWLYHLGVMITPPGWHLPVALLDLAGYYGLTALLDRQLKSGKNAPLSRQNQSAHRPRRLGAN